MLAPSSHKKWFDNNRGLLVLALVTIAFYIHNLLSPEFLDDYVYKFVFDKTGPDYSQRISNLWDVFRSQYGFYFAWNGRTVVQWTAQLFCGLLGKQVFNVMNALVFGAFIYLLRRQVAGNGQLTLFSYAVVVALVLMLPTFCETFLWVTGSVNYLWCSTGVLLFLWYYEKNRGLPVDRRSIEVLTSEFARVRLFCAMKEVMLVLMFSMLTPPQGTQCLCCMSFRATPWSRGNPAYCAKMLEKRQHCGYFYSQMRLPRGFQPLAMTCLC